MSETKLYNEDCLITIKKMICSGEKVNHSFTSPPYNRKRNDKYSRFDDINDNWFELNCKVIDGLLKVTIGHIFYNIQANYYNRSDVYKIIGKYADNIKDIHIWEKSNPMPASGKSITNAVEYFIVLGDKSLKSNKTYTKNIVKSSVNSNMPQNHKAVMKPEIARHFIENFTSEGDVIYDPFMGEGTTGVICKNLNRRFIGSELIEEYFNDSLLNINNANPSK